MPITPGVRRSLNAIQAEYEQGDKEALELLMRAWHGVKQRAWDDPGSFFRIGGYHGEPFRNQGATDPAWWGGYCEHGSVLFPTWHRAYLHALEQALQSVEGCSEVMLAFWDETSPESLVGGIPAALTWETFELDGKTIPNPLRSFVLPVAIDDQVKGDNPVYSKPEGYETVRYPLSGLMGTEADREATAAHNAQYPDPEQNVALLNGNVSAWLTRSVSADGQVIGGFVAEKFVRCLDAPTYTLFSNTTSATAHNTQQAGAVKVVPLESPHNSIHLAIGGFDVPLPDGSGHDSPIPGANGDMGENDTAGLDPIFYFHHCYIDYAFWIWQRRHGSTQSIEIDPDDPGAGYSASNPPPAGRTQDERLDDQSALHPFTTAAGDPVTSADVADIAGLGYAYGPGSLDAFAAPQLAAVAPGDASAEAARAVHVTGLDRSKVRGSFVISAFAEVDGRLETIGHEAILSRWQVDGCANCMSHLRAGATFPLPPGARAATEGTTDGVQVHVTTRHDLLRSRGDGALAAAAVPDAPSFTVDVR